MKMEPLVRHGVSILEGSGSMSVWLMQGHGREPQVGREMPRLLTGKL